MRNQKIFWDNLHTKGNLSKHSESETKFAIEVNSLLKQPANILELGCGVGNDSYYFASKNNKVIATDFSKVVTDQNKLRYKDMSNLLFNELDMSSFPYPFKENEFNVVYARLSLHYFTDLITKKIVDEVKRILKPEGYFCFLNKSDKDPLYGKGEFIEKDMYIADNHVKHFFSEQYVREILKNKFNILKIESGEEYFYKEKSSYIKVIVQN